MDFLSVLLTIETVDSDYTSMYVISHSSNSHYIVFTDNVIEFVLPLI